MKKRFVELINLFSIVFVFTLLSYLTSSHLEWFSGLLGAGLFGMFVYFMLTVSAIVLAPISTIPLIPLASSMWGWQVTSLLNAVGWTVGAVIAFSIARMYGSGFVEKFLPVRKLRELEDKIPNRNIFWGVVVLRILLPVDVLSYAIGLFSKMSLRSYTLATFIGVIPYAVFFSYVSEIPFRYQLVVIAFFTIVLSVSILKHNPIRRKSSKHKK